MKKNELFVSAFGGEEVFTGLVKDEMGVWLHGVLTRRSRLFLDRG